MKWTQNDGMTRCLSLEYKINYFRGRDGGLNEPAEPPFEGAGHVECALRALTQLEAMFDVLGFVRGRGLGDAEGAAETLENFAALGQMLASAAYSHVIEAEAVLERRARG